MARSRLRAALALLVLALACASARAQDGAPPPGMPYTNQDLGFSMVGPGGWSVESGAVAAPQWQPMAVFSDRPSGARIVVSVRKATANTLGRLRQEVTETCAKESSLQVNAITDLPATGRRPLPGLLVDAQQSRPAEGAAGGAPAPPVTWRVETAYFLGGDVEYRVEASVRATLAAKHQAAIDRALDSVTFKAHGAATTPRGESTFRDDAAGFACVYPTGYGVRIPGREEHLVEFAPAGAGPVIGVHRKDSGQDLDEEAKAVVEFYKGDEVGGEATAGRVEIAGRASVFVTAKGRIDAKDRVFVIGLVKRGNDLFRLEVSAEEGQQEAVKAAFDAFARRFVLLNP